MTYCCCKCQKLFHRTNNIIGQDDVGQYVEFMGRLKRHVERKHPETIQAAVTLGSELTGLVIFSCFSSTDAAFLGQREEIRARIHDATAPQPVEAIVGTPASTDAASDVTE